MPGTVGVALAVCFALVAGHRVVRRDPPGALMAAGMAAMSLDMAGIGPIMVHGWWWALAFVLVAAWPVVRKAAGRAVCGGPLAHLLGGVAMVYMCLVTTHAAPVTVTSVRADLAPVGHAGHEGHADLADLVSPVGSGPSLVAVLGWALACYFLLGTVAALTRRSSDGRLAGARLTGLGQAIMGFGTVIMLVAII